MRTNWRGFERGKRLCARGVERRLLPGQGIEGEAGGPCHAIAATRASSLCPLPLTLPFLHTTLTPALPGPKSPVTPCLQGKVCIP